MNHCCQSGSCRLISVMLPGASRSVLHRIMVAKLISVMLPGASRSVLHRIVVAKLISVPDAFQICAAQDNGGQADISDAAWCLPGLCCTG